MEAGLQLVGWREFVRDARKAEAELPKLVRKGLYNVAKEGAQRGRARLASGPGQAPTTARTVRPGASANSAYVRLGGNPTAMGDEFGSLRFKQFRRWRGSGVEAGYGVYPATREMTQSGDTERLLWDELDKVIGILSD